MPDRVMLSESTLDIGLLLKSKIAAVQGETVNLHHFV